MVLVREDLKVRRREVLLEHSYLCIQQNRCNRNMTSGLLSVDNLPSWAQKHFCLLFECCLGLGCLWLWIFWALCIVWAQDKGCWLHYIASIFYCEPAYDYLMSAIQTLSSPVCIETCYIHVAYLTLITSSFVTWGRKCLKAIQEI